jgi:uncharacterized protein YkwD
MRWRLALCALLACPAHASDATDIVGSINAWRATPAECRGQLSPALPPLQPDARLAAVTLGPGRFLQQDMERAGYRSLQAQAIGVRGARDAQEVMALMRQQYCATLRDPVITDIGVAQAGDGWTIIVAREDIVPPLPSQEAAARMILAATNRARATGRTCGTQYFAAAPPLVSNNALDQAALVHSTEMAALRYFSHEGQDGSQVSDRAKRAGYDWQAIGENIASGMRTPEDAVAGWVESPGHCANLMNPHFIDLGSGYGVSAATGIVFWTQAFGTPLDRR